jgi:hypothetical protein
MSKKQSEELIDSLLAEMRSAVRHLDNKGKGGQHVSWHGDFVNASPHVVDKFRWWLREIDTARTKESEEEQNADDSGSSS